MIATNDFRRGTKIEYKGEAYEVVEFQHVKMGRGGAFVRAKMKGLKSGKIIEDTFNSGEKFPKANLQSKQMQYLYLQDSMYYFMDMENYEQIPLTEDQLGSSKSLLKEGMVATILYHKEAPLAVELPIFVELVIAETEPGFKGDTASGGAKPARLETGALIKVPFHINQGDTIKVDTRTMEYIERVK
ncbi:MAG: elongation factor P [Nitrospirae bacterium]|nr:elongation factor P [Nitrospirota bacterium]